MSGECEYGKCAVCSKETFLRRVSFHYQVKCECHSPCHFEYISVCKDCKVEEPKYTKLTVSTAWLREACKRMEEWTDED